MRMLHVQNWDEFVTRDVEVTGKPDSDGFVKTSAGMLPVHHLFPYEALPEVKAVLKEREQSKKAFEDSIKSVYQLNNKYFGKKGF